MIEDYFVKISITNGDDIIVHGTEKELKSLVKKIRKVQCDPTTSWVDLPELFLNVDLIYCIYKPEPFEYSRWEIFKTFFKK